MDKKKGILNIGVSAFFKIFLLIGSILVRRFLIQYIGNDANGLSSLYTSMIGFLSVVELGVGEAITFCMYKPIVERDTKKVAALYRLFKKMYLIIGGIIFVAGMIVMFFLPNLAKDYSQLNSNVYLTFMLTLISVVMTYTYSAKISLINAYKYNYLVTGITSVGTIIEDILKIGTIIFTRSFEAYLICGIIAVVVQWLLVNLVCQRKFADVIEIKNIEIDKESKEKIVNNIKAMFMHKIGNILVNTVDSMVISAFVGVIALGKYSNYTTIMLSMTGFLTLFFNSLTSIVGHAFVKESKEQMKKYFNVFYGFNYALGVIFCMGYYAVIDNVILFCFGNNLGESRAIVFVITLNYFIQFMRSSMLMFRASTGTFYYDRYKPIVEGIVNMLLSILLVKRIGIVGVIVATIITNLMICDIVEPYVVYKHALENKVKPFYITNFSYIAVFAICLIALQQIMISTSSPITEFIVNGCFSIAISLVPLALLWITNRDFKDILNNLIFRLKKKRSNV